MGMDYSGAIDGCECNSCSDKLRAENERLRAEVAADVAIQPCGHAAKWMAYRNPVDAKSERYCVFCEVERLQTAIVTFCKSRRGACDGWKRQSGIAALFEIAAEAAGEKP